MGGLCPHPKQLNEVPSGNKQKQLKVIVASALATITKKDKGFL